MEMSLLMRPALSGDLSFSGVLSWLSLIKIVPLMALISWSCWHILVSLFYIHKSCSLNLSDTMAGPTKEVPAQGCLTGLATSFFLSTLAYNQPQSSQLPFWLT